jgi:hypothetical protein
MDGHHQYLAANFLLLKMLQHLNPSHVRHADIHQDQIRRGLFNYFQDLNPVHCLANNFQAGLGIQQIAQPCA